MRCGCPMCGTYMVQRERGLESGCICPACSEKCNACVADGQHPSTVEDIRRFRESYDSIPDPEGLYTNVDDNEIRPNWHKLL